jgi:hypothetical protein
MEKYGTYNVFEHKDTKEIKRVPLANETEMVKIANGYEWRLLDKDPEDKNEDKGHISEKSA